MGVDPDICLFVLKYVLMLNCTIFLLFAIYFSILTIWPKLLILLTTNAIILKIKVVWLSLGQEIDISSIDITCIEFVANATIII